MMKLLCRRYSHARKVRASALFTALALLVMAASIVTLLITVQRVGIRRTDSLLETDKMRYHIQQVEWWAIAEIDNWRRTDAKIYQWPVEMPTISLQHGSVRGRLEDWQGKYNVSSTRVRTFKEHFARAIAELIDDLSIEEAKTLTENIRERFLRTPFPILPSELRLVDGIDAKRYQQLLPHISLLNSPSLRININAIDGQHLQAMSVKMTEEDGKRFDVLKAEKQGFESVNEFTSAFPDLDFPKNLFTTRSYFYLLTSEVEEHDAYLKTYTLIQVTGTKLKPKIAIRWRSQSL